MIFFVSLTIGLCSLGFRRLKCSSSFFNHKSLCLNMPTRVERILFSLASSRTLRMTAIASSSSLRSACEDSTCTCPKYVPSCTPCVLKIINWFSLSYFSTNHNPFKDTMDVTLETFAIKCFAMSSFSSNLYGAEATDECTSILMSSPTR